MNVRMATLNDAESICEVLKQAFSIYETENYPLEAVKTAIVPLSEIRKRIKKECVLVAEQRGIVVGTVTGLMQHKSMYVCSLAVLPECQNLGVATKLLMKIEGLAKNLECNKLWLCAVPKIMEKAIGLYEKLGYEREGFLKKHFYGEDFLLLSKLIGEDHSRNRSPGEVLICENKF